MSRAIPVEEISFHHGSFADPHGRLFFWQGELYRGLRRAFAGVVERLAKDRLLRGLCEEGLVVDSRFADLKLDGFDQVVWHRALPYVTYANEWSPSMLKDAALLVLDLEIRLARHGLTIGDAHPWNVLFDTHAPRFVDLCAFKLASPSAGRTGPRTWEGFETFCRYFLNPLLVMEGGLDRISRLSFLDQGGVRVEELGEISSTSRQRRRIKAIRALRKRSGVPEIAGDSAALRTKLRHSSLTLISRFSSNPVWRMQVADRERFLQTLREWVAGIGTPTPQGEWSQYYRQSPKPGEKDSTDADSDKLKGVRAVLERLQPSSVVDVGANTGFFSRVALDAGASVVAIDSEVSCIDELYLQAKREDHALNCAVIDVKNPSPAIGPVNSELPSCLRRLESDVVLALGITHHLAHKSLMTFEQMVSTFSSWARRGLVVEYVPPDDEHVSAWNLQGRSWYGKEELVGEVAKYFERIEVLDSFPAGRKLVIATRRSR